MQISNAALEICRKSFYFGYRGQTGLLWAAADSSRSGGESSVPQNTRSLSAATWSVCIVLLLAPAKSWSQSGLFLDRLFPLSHNPLHWTMAEGENKGEQRHPREERIQPKCSFGFAVLYHSKLIFVFIYVINTDSRDPDLSLDEVSWGLWPQAAAHPTQRQKLIY